MAFEAFLEEARPPRPRAGRMLALIASVVGHGVLVLGAAALFLKPVVQAAMPRSVPVILRLPPPVARTMPPAPPVVEAAAAPTPAVPRPARRRLRAPRPEAPPVAAPESAPAPPPEQPAAAVETAAVPPATAPATAAASSATVVTPPAAAPAPPPPRPRFLPEALASSQKLSGEMPRLPPALARSGTSHVVLARICIGTTGQVESVTLERSAHPAVDAEVRGILPTWRYRPLRVAGQLIPFCTFIRFEFRTL
jgi:hypothetical protein